MLAASDVHVHPLAIVERTQTIICFLMPHSLNVSISNLFLFLVTVLSQTFLRSRDGFFSEFSLPFFN